MRLNKIFILRDLPKPKSGNFQPQKKLAYQAAFDYITEKRW
jgi:hypothetical protein